MVSGARFESETSGIRHRNAKHMERIKRHAKSNATEVLPAKRVIHTGRLHYNMKPILGSVASCSECADERSGSCVTELT